MDRVRHMISVGKEAEEEDFEDDETAELGDWQLPIAFNKKRHTEKIEGSKTETQTWRMKERVGNNFVTWLLYKFYVRP